VATETYQTQLERVQAAIAAIETRGQTIGEGGRHLQRGDLEALYKREKYLRQMAARETRGGIRMRQGVPL
jgi:hypothetical protein